jgi:hypothetical protein
MSKISLFLSKEHLKQMKSGNNFLRDHQLQLLTEACFDWLITDVKVATKVYAMRALFEFGTIQEWVLPQLKSILEKDYGSHTAAYHSASKALLRKMR